MGLQAILQKALEPLCPDPKSMGLVSRIGQGGVLSLQGFVSESRMLALEGLQFELSLPIAQFGLTNGGSQMKTIDMKPTKLMRRCGEISRNQLLIACVHIRQTEFDRRLPP